MGVSVRSAFTSLSALHRCVASMRRAAGAFTICRFTELPTNLFAERLWIPIRTVAFNDPLEAAADAILHETVTTGQGVPGVVAMVTDRAGNIYEGAVGKPPEGRVRTDRQP
jgi:hypothetical protein